MLIIVKSGWWEHRGSLCMYQNDTPSTLVGGYILLYIFETSHNNTFFNFGALETLIKSRCKESCHGQSCFF